MNLQDLTEYDLAFVLDIEQDGMKVGEVEVPATTLSRVVAYIVHEAEEGIYIELANTPKN